MAGLGQVKGTFVILGGAATVVVGVLVGVLLWDRTEAPSADARAQTKAASSAVTPAQPQAPAAAQGASGATPATETAPPARTPEARSASAAATSTPEASAPGPAKEAAQPAEPPILPSFDVVRVEKDGDSVIAGRAVPGATIELLRNDQVHARAVADASGLFAVVPPPLPRGSHQIVLQSIAPDGTRQRSRESVTVVIGGEGRPLVALAAPDKPTVLLSNPEPPEAKPAQEASAQPMPQPPAPANQEAPAAPATPRPEVKITSVDSEDGGRLYVSGLAASGATVRLYLNETFIAPGGAGTDGKVSFAIGRGVKPGDYRVRLDDVDPVSGTVKSRAEVDFNVPAQVAAEPSPSSPPATTTGPQTPTQQASAPTPAVPGGAGNQAASADSGSKSVPPSTVLVPDINTATVSRGDSLWRISRRIYGDGYRYTVIYGANQKQIRNPNRIYPGQVFVLPADQARN